VRKILFGIVGVLVVLAAGALVAPSFIDWNAYKGQIAEAARDATGRTLVIDGDIGAALLPMPALSVANARLGNARGAKAPDMVAFKSLSVRVAPWPLLKGEVQVQAVILVDPVIELERLADGSGNWEFRPPAAKTAPGAAQPATGGGAAPAVRVDRVEIRNGRVVYRDAKAGTLETVERLNAELGAESLSGPFTGRADFVTHAAPLAVEFSVGGIAGQPIPVTLALDLGGGKAKAGFTGTVSALGPNAKITGKLKSESGNLAAALAPLGVASTPFLARPLALEAQIDASAAQAAIKDMRVALGEIGATGAVTATLSERPRIEAVVNVGAVNLDRLMAAAGTPGAPVAVAAPGKAGAPGATGAGFALPTNIAARLDLSVAAVTFQDGTAQQGKLLANLADGVLTIERLGALLPGNTDAKVTGRLSAARGEPQFTGRVDVASDNARAVLAWLKADTAGVPANRLRQLRLGAAVNYGGPSVGLSGIDLRLDDTRMTGSLSYGLGPKPVFGVDLAVDTFNLDAYLPQTAAAAAKAPAAAQPAPRPAAGGGGTLPDGDVRIKIAQLTWAGRPIKGIDVDGALRSGGLELKRAAIGDFAGISASAAGRIEGLTGAPRVDLRLSGEGKDLAQIARGLGVDYRPAATNLGGFRLAAAVKGDASAVQIANLKGNIGPASIEGEAGLRLDKGKPHLTARLAASEVLVDLFLPAAAAAAGAGAPRTPAANARPAAAAERWSREKIDLGYLHALDADVTLAARGIQFADYSFKEPQVVLALANGALEVKKLSGRLFGGAVELKARVAAGDVNSATVEVSLAGADLKQALVTALQMDRVAGKFGMSGRFEARGNSQYDMVRALNGKAVIEAGEGMVTGIDLRRLSDRLKQLDKVTDVLNLVGGAMSGGQTRLISAKGTWAAERGVFRSSDTVAALDGAEATVNGGIDLPNWQMDIVSRMRLSEHPTAPPVGVDLRGPIDQPVRDVKTRELEVYVTERAGGAVLRGLLKDRAPGAQQPAPGTTQGQPPAKPASPAEQLLRGILKNVPQR
jgi:uncharacterized protein involved in outer membrane biogenesis